MNINGIHSGMGVNSVSATSQAAPKAEVSACAMPKDVASFSGSSTKSKGKLGQLVN